MIRQLPTLLALLLLLALPALCIFTEDQDDEDLIDISNITSFPQDYSHNIRAGYLNISSYNAAFYYLFCER